MAEQCDMACGREINEEDRYEVRRPRPSDPRDMCCIMWICDECGVQQAEGTKDVDLTDGGTKVLRRSEWAEWIETDDARKAGYLWLT